MHWVAQNSSQICVRMASCVLCELGLCTLARLMTSHLDLCPHSSECGNLYARKPNLFYKTLCVSGSQVKHLERSIQLQTFPARVIQTMYVPSLSSMCKAVRYWQREQPTDPTPDEILQQFVHSLSKWARNWQLCNWNPEHQRKGKKTAVLLFATFRGQYPKIGKTKNRKSVSSTKDMYCWQVLTFLSHLKSNKLFAQNWSTCYYFLRKKLIFFKSLFWGVAHSVQPSASTPEPPNLVSHTRWCKLLFSAFSGGHVSLLERSVATMTFPNDFIRPTFVPSLTRMADLVRYWKPRNQSDPPRKEISQRFRQALSKYSQNWRFVQVNLESQSNAKLFAFYLSVSVRRLASQFSLSPNNGAVHFFNF